MTSSWIASVACRAPGEHVGDRRLGLGRRRRSSPTGCPAGRGRPRATLSPLRAEDVGERAHRRSSCRCRPSARGPRSCRPSAAVYPRPARGRRAGCRAPRVRPRLERRRAGRAVVPSPVRDGALGDLDEVQPVAADDDLVAVLQRAPLDALAVDEHAVEAAVVEHAHAVGLAHDQRVAARDGRVVEAHVGGEAAADPRPLARERRRRGRCRRRGRRGTRRARRARSRAAATSARRSSSPSGSGVGARSGRRRTARPARTRPAAPGQSGRGSEASVTTYPHSSHRNEPVPASVPDVSDSIGCNSLWSSRACTPPTEHELVPNPYVDVNAISPRMAEIARFRGPWRNAFGAAANRSGHAAHHLSGLSEGDLERVLLRKGVDARDAGRAAAPSAGAIR